MQAFRQAARQEADPVADRAAQIAQDFRKLNKVEGPLQVELFRDNSLYVSWRSTETPRLLHTRIIATDNLELAGRVQRLLLEPAQPVQTPARALTVVMP